MKKPGTWGDHFCVQACCELYNVNVVVFELNFSNTALRITHDLRDAGLGGWESYLLKCDDIKNGLNSLPIINLVRYGGHYGIIRAKSEIAVNVDKISLGNSLQFKLSELKALQWQNNNYNCSEPSNKKAKHSNSAASSTSLISGTTTSTTLELNQIDNLISINIQNEHFYNLENGNYLIPDAATDPKNNITNTDYKQDTDCKENTTVTHEISDSDISDAEVPIGLVLPSLASGDPGSIIYSNPAAKKST